MAKEKTLKSGLQELLKEYNLLEEAEKLQQTPKNQQVKIKITEISANPFQPRSVFNKEKLLEMAASIKVHGVFTPILVRKVDKGYQLVAGERRLRAATLAGLKEIPAVISNFNDNESLEIALIENIQRDNLNAVEEANGYKSMIEKLGYSQEVIAKRVGKSRSHITNTLRLLLLPEEILAKVKNNTLTMGQVKPLIGLKEKDAIELATKISKEKLNSRKIESLVKYKYKNKGHINNWQQQFINQFKEIGIAITFSNKSVKLEYNNEEQIKQILTNCLKK